MDTLALALNGAIDVAVPIHTDPIGPGRREIHHRAAELRRAVRRQIVRQQRHAPGRRLSLRWQIAERSVIVCGHVQRRLIG